LNHDNDSEGELYDSREISDKELEQANKIRHRLDKDGQVQFIARQSKHASLLSVRENIVSVSYDKIISIELERGVFSSKIIIRTPGFADEMEAISKKSGRTNSSICE